MAYRINIRIDEETGQIEDFTVEAVGGGPLGYDHDDEHEDFTRTIADLIDLGALIEEVVPVDGPVGPAVPIRLGTREQIGLPEAEQGPSR